MSEILGARRPLRKASDKITPTDAATSVEHPSERKARLKEKGENGKLNRWRQKVCTGAFLGLAFIVFAVWAVVFLSGRFSPEEKNQVTEVIKAVLYGVACFAAGKGFEKWTGS